MAGGGVMDSYGDILALFSGDEATAQEKAAALAAQLRRQRAAGMLGALTGDKVLGNIGQQQLQQAQGIEQMLGGAAQHRAEQQVGLQKAMAAQKAKLEEEKRAQAEWDRRNAITSPQSDRRALMMAGVQFGNQQKMTDYRAQVEAAQKAAENAQKAQEGIPPEYEAIGKPSTEQKNKFTAGLSSAEKLKGMSSQLRAMVNQAGGIDRVIGPQRKQMDTLLRQIQIEGKNVAELGALSGPDFALMQELVQDPNSFSSLLFDMGTKGLDQVDRWADTQVSGAMKAYGIRKRPPKVEAPKAVKGKDGKSYVQGADGSWEEAEDGP